MSNRSLASVSVGGASLPLPRLLPALRKSFAAADLQRAKRRERVECAGDNVTSTLTLSQMSCSPGVP